MDYTEVVSSGELTAIRLIFESIQRACQIEVVAKPSYGMLMGRMIDSVQNTPFYLGEIFVTQCEVAVNGHPGYSCVIGRETDRAYYGSCIDAVMNSSMLIRSEIENMIKLQSGEIHAKRLKEETLVQKTRVRFDISPGH